MSPTVPGNRKITRGRPVVVYGGIVKVFDSVDEKLAAWIGRQRMFFVGTAPSGVDGHVNVSPKGPIESLRILGPTSVAYLDLGGSGIETIAHLRQNGRIVIMLCAFEGPPRIVRLHGSGEVVQVGTPEYAELVVQLGLDAVPQAGELGRSIIRIELSRISDSCGYGVPLLEYTGTRPQQAAWMHSVLAKKGPNGIVDYLTEMNGQSVDGLPGLDTEALPRRSTSS